MNKKVFGGLIVLGSIGLAALISLYFVWQGEAIPLPVLLVPSVALLLGFVIMVTDSLEVLELSDEVENAGELIADDIDDLKHFRPTRTWAYVVMAIISLATELWLLDYYHKWYASWGPVNVLFVGVIIVLLAAYFMFRSYWFQNRDERVSGWIYWVVLGGFVLCLGLGVYFTEPLEYGGLSRNEQIEHIQSERYWQYNRMSHYYFFNSYSSSGSSFDIDLDCKGDACLGLVIVIIVAICVLSSALIPHFWVAATMLMCALMALIALRELLYVEQHSYRRSYARWQH